MDIDEKYVCIKCSKKEKCKFRDEGPQHNKKAQISDLLVVLNVLSDVPSLKGFTYLIYRAVRARK